MMCKSRYLPSLKLTACPWKWMVAILVSLWVSAYFPGRTVSFSKGTHSWGHSNLMLMASNSCIVCVLMLLFFLRKIGVSSQKDTQKKWWRNVFVKNTCGWIFVGFLLAQSFSQISAFSRIFQYHVSLCSRFKKAAMFFKSRGNVWYELFFQWCSHMV